MKLNYSFFLLIFISQNAIGQSDSLKKHDTYLGLNILRIATGDIELQALHKLSKRFMVGISGGYDFNFLDFNKRYHVNATKKMESIEQLSSPEKRYFQGKGSVFRLYFDFNLLPSKQRQWFFSLEGLYKIRNYTKHDYGVARIVHLESANQQISGLTLYSGINYYGKNEHNLMRFYWGIGFRVLKSEVTWPGYHYDISYYPEKKFTHALVLPSIHVGLVLMRKL